MDKYHEQQLEIATEGFVESLVLDIKRGDYDEHLKQIARAIFDRRDVITKEDGDVAPITPKVKVDKPDINVTQPAPTMPKKTRPYTSRSGIGKKSDGITLTDSSVRSGTFQPSPKNILATKIDGEFLANVDWFMYGGKYYAKSLLKGVTFAIPQSADLEAARGLNVTVTGVGNKMVKVEITQKPQDGLEGSEQLNEAWQQKTPIFLPLIYISNFIED